MSSIHLLKKCLDCENLTTKTWCKPCGYKNRRKNTWSLGLSHSEETKLKISNSKKGIGNPKHSEWMKENGSRIFTGCKKPRLADEKNVNWRGDDVGYRGLHYWVVSKLGRPEECTRCHRNGLSGRQIHWANISHNYLREVTDWLRLCAKCHKAYDLGRIKL